MNPQSQLLSKQIFFARLENASQAISSTCSWQEHQPGLIDLLDGRHLLSGSTLLSVTERKRCEQFISD